MHLNQIHSFLTVSKTLNFTGAARQLGVPQSTISRQINDLESQLGVRLFYRTKRDVQLTDEGRIFLPFAQEIADAARKGSYAVRQLHEGASGRLSLAVVPACRPGLTDILAAFHQQYPDITVDLTLLSAGTSLMDETDTPYDFWFLYRDMLLDPENFDYLPLHRQPLCILRRSSGAKAGQTLPKQPGQGGRGAERNPTKKPADPLPDRTDLSSESFILLSEETDPILYMQIMNYCRTHRFTPRVTNTFEDFSSVLLSVSAGLGITIAPASLLSELNIPQSPGASASADAMGTSLPLTITGLEDESYAIDCVAAWKPSLLNPAAGLFLETMKKAVPQP